MKAALMKAAAAIIAAVMLAACSSGGETQETESGGAAPDITGSVNESAEIPAPPFESYSFSFTGVTENYIVTVSRSERPCDISVTLENNRYESRDFVITAPDGYEPRFPSGQDEDYAAVNLITNDIDDSDVPDIMQLSFDITGEGQENSPDELPGAISRMYTVDENGELRLIMVEENSDPDGETEDIVLDYLDRTQLYHSEPAKFIYEITVDDSSLYDEIGRLRPMLDRVRIKTLTFEYDVPRLIAGYEEITEDNPLYFGYACWAAANTAARYFTEETLAVSDPDDYAEVTAPDGGYEYFYAADDPRFGSVPDLKRYLRSIFTRPTADKIFADAPQRYRSINGKLCTAAVSGESDPTLGVLTFSGMSISDSRMVFRSRQEKFDESGRFTGYTDGGNFIIEKNDSGEWRVSTYRYPYSLS